MTTTESVMTGPSSEQLDEVAVLQAQFDAIQSVQAVIEFDLQGNILNANPNFLEAMGYSEDEVVGQHHGMFVEPAYRESAEYRQFWARLGAGNSHSGEFKRVGKGGREIWIEASYNPIRNGKGDLVKVIKFAIDVTEAKRSAAESSGQLAALDKVMATIEFDLDGTIRTANQNFLDAVGYSLDEVRGKHHSMFVAADYRESAEYRQFWQDLGAGRFHSGEYKRYGRDGREIWIQASYNPILDVEGRPFKVVKFATDITEAKLRNADFEGQLAAIGKAMATIEFDLDGTIRTANQNFLDTVGYSLTEIQGRHHGMFVGDEVRDSAEYREFWQALGSGEFRSGEFRRVGKGGKEIWIQASYNPIFDAEGRPFKVVKFASDITDVVRQRLVNNRYASMVDGMPIGTLFADRDNRIQYVNRASEQMLVQLEKYLPVRADQLVGQSVDIFHKDPGFQQRLLSDPSNLPRQANITVGPEKLDLLVSAVHDAEGNHLGAMVTWSVITEKLRIEENIEGSAQSLAGAAEELTATSQSMAEGAGQAAERASTVSAAAEQVSNSIQTVATGAQELEASIREIAQNASEAAAVATQAVEVADQTNATINKLGDSSAEIGQVIKVITSIAQQTNLLALNATIEAARAGEAGKGFAVVANEVKELAKETAKATEEIGQKIEAIQADTGGAVEAIREIGGIIEKINDFQATIASAVEEQTATTNEIGRNLGEAAKGSGEIAQSINTVADSSKDVSQGASDTQRAAGELAELAANLQSLVGPKD